MVGKAAMNQNCAMRVQPGAKKTEVAQPRLTDERGLIVLAIESVPTFRNSEQNQARFRKLG
jgi:hypothetical protein